MAPTNTVEIQSIANEARNEAVYQQWKHWPVNWSAVLVGTLSAVSIIVVLGLYAVAIGLEELNPESRLVDLHQIPRLTLVFSICAAFFSFVTAGWIASKIAGILHAEPAMLHGAIVWCSTVPFLALIASASIKGSSNNWFGALSSQSVSSSSPYTLPLPLVSTASDYDRRQYEVALVDYAKNVKRWNEETPRVMKNSALCGATALILSLIGSVLGGWMASGEPMTFTYRRSVKSDNAVRAI